MTASTGATAGGYTVPLTAGSADVNTEGFLGLMSGGRRRLVTSNEKRDPVWSVPFCLQALSPCHCGSQAGAHGQVVAGLNTQ